MDKFEIPPQGEVPTEASEFTKQEMANLTPHKRSTILYETLVEDHKNQTAYLRQLIEEEKREKQELSDRCCQLQEKADQNPALRRAKTEMFAAFFLSTAAMTLGSLAIGTHPPVNGVMQWEATAGWALVLLAIVMGLGNRLLVWFMVYLFPNLFHNRD